MEGSNLPLGEQCAAALETAAVAKTEALRLRKMAERIYDRIFLETEARNVSEREAKARVHAAYLSADDAALEAESEAIIARSRSDGLAVKWESWRTQSATDRAEMTLGQGRP